MFFRYIIVWLLANYSFDNMIKSYNSYYSENTFGEMSKFIKEQQYREDQLRSECNLQYYKIKEKPSYITQFSTYMKDSLSLDIYDRVISLKYNIPSIYIMDSILSTSSLEEFYTLSYNKENLHKQIKLNDTVYKIVYSGNKVDNTIYSSYSNQQYLPEPHKPIWTLTVGNHTLTITDIK